MAKYFLGSAAALALMACAASAATVEFDFSGGTGDQAASLDFNAGGLGLNVTALTYEDDYDQVGSGLVGHWSTGLGAKNWGYDSHQVDGFKNWNDMIVFAFDKAVHLLNVTFSYVDHNDDFQLFTFDAGEYVLEGSADIPGYGSTGTTYEFQQSWFGETFGIGAYGKNDNFKISALTVKYDDTTPIPLPAAAWTLIAGLGALAGMRRLKRS